MVGVLVTLIGLAWLALGALGYPALIHRLVAGGVDPEAPCDEANVWLPGDTVTPLPIAAVEHGRDDVVRILVEHGAGSSSGR